MPKIALSGGAYQARSVIASAQRSLNLYAEPMAQAQGEPAQFAYYPTPGLRLLGTLPQGPVRAIRQATTGGIYAIAGSGVYLVDPTAWTGTLLGSITALRPYPVSMQDNGSTLVIVDGTSGGWTVDLASHAFAAISDEAFYGADKVDYLDTYLLFNKPGTPQFYTSDSLATTFDSLYFANKESFSDILITLAVAKREIWLLGERTTEVWYNAGAQDFPFQQIQSTFVDHGCRAKYSVATYDDALYWLSYDRAGQGIVITGAGYQVNRISTYAIENELTRYPRLDDAIGFIYSLAGHVYYVLTFPHADHTWAYDITTKQWHEWLWIDDNGEEHRHRANCAYAINGMVVAGDHENGNLYAVEVAAYTDDGQPIKRQRSYPHLINEMDRVYYRQFLADIESGNAIVSNGQAAGTPYSAHLVQINTNLGGLSRANTAWGFPASTNFHTLLMNYWMCGPYQTTPGLTGSPSIWPAFNAADFLAFGPGNSSAGGQFIQLTNQTLGPNTPFFTGNIPNPLPTAPLGCLLHFMMSVDTHAQIVQVYVNDKPVTVASPTWGSSPPYDFNIGTSNIWQWVVAGVLGTGIHPALADVWISNTPAFVDLSVAANRRKFISSGMTPVDLGATGTVPFGYQPAMYMSVRPGGVAPDILNNLGVGGGAWGYSQNPPTFQTDGACIAIPAPPVFANPPGSQVFLDWSDDRGHSYGNPVGQSIGATGAYLTSLQWQRLGLARDRVFRLSFSAPVATALQGAWIEADTSAKS